jgi:predicted permease
MESTVRRSTRRLTRAPGFVLSAVSVLGLALAANAIVLSLVEAILVRPLPALRDTQSLVDVHRTTPGSTSGFFSAPDYRDLRDAAATTLDVAAYSGRGARLGGDDSAQLLALQVVSGNYFRVLGVEAFRGRALGLDDDKSGAPAVAVVSHDFWRTRMGGLDPTGRTVHINGHAFTVVGVMPPGFRGHFVGFPFEAWVTLATGSVTAPGQDLASRGDAWLELVARRPAGWSLPATQAKVAQAFTPAREAAPEVHREASTRVIPYTGIDESLRRGVSAFLALLQGLALVVFAVACVNVGGMMLARRAAGRRDTAIRVALGGSRAAIAREGATEIALLFLAAGLCGTLLARWGVEVVQAVQPVLVIPLRLDLALGPTVLGALFVLATTGALLCAALPTLETGRIDVASALQSGRAGAPPQTRARRVFVGAQVALSVVLLVVGGLFLRTVAAAGAFDPGFVRENVVTARLDLTLLRVSEDEQRKLLARLVQRLQAMPGVSSVAYATGVPLRTAPAPKTVRVPGRETPTAADATVVGPAYFSTLRIPLAAGRELSETDDPRGAPVAVISETLAQRLFGETDAVGRRIVVDERERLIVGVARDVAHRDATSKHVPFLYLPLTQQESPRVRLLVRAEGDPAPLVARVRAAIAAAEPRLPALEVASLGDIIAVALFPQRAAGALGAVLGVSALVLAALGLYGLLAFSVVARTPEIGVRMALGARSLDVARLVVGDALRVTVAGLCAGGLCAMAAAHALRAFLAGVSPADPLTFLGTAVLLVAVTIVASLAPAWRASRVSPLVALRQ